MNTASKRATAVAGLVGGLLLSAIPVAAAQDPTCSGIVGDVHGHHVVGDYVTGVGNAALSWPPAGAVNASGGAAVPGGPGPGFHFEHGFAPGASFCISQANSPGLHL